MCKCERFNYDESIISVSGSTSIWYTIEDVKVKVCESEVCVNGQKSER